MTFSRRAAAEMSHRVQRILQKDPLSDGASHYLLPWAGTFHGVGARLLRDHAEQIGLNRGFHDPRRADSEDLMNIVRHELGFSKTHDRFPKKGTCLAIYSRVINTEATIEEVAEAVLSPVRRSRRRSQEALRSLCGGQAAPERPRLRRSAALLGAGDERAMRWRRIAGRFDHVLVDEYQDTNRLQSRILLGLKPQGRGMTVVGDDAQSIYSFRAATVRNILDFPAYFDPPAAIVTLEQNYRSMPADPYRGERRDRPGERALHQESLDEPCVR